MSRIQTLLNKYAQGACSRDEFEELMHLLRQDENDEELRIELRKLYDSFEREIISETSINDQGHFVQEGPFTSEYNNERSISWKKWVLAASIFLCIGVGLLAFLFNKYLNNEFNEKQVSQISTPAGSKTSVVLPDGTKVWLNSYSTLTFTTGFVDGKREVSLVGEAMFEVKHDSLHPFLVHTKNFDVSDLGTVFNIQAYPDDNKSTASLISGSIEIALKTANTKKIVLVPNQRITIQNDQYMVTDPSKVDQPVVNTIVPDAQTREVPDTAWMVNKLIFHDESFKDLSMSMQRRYNVEILFENQKAKQYRFTGRFEDESIEEALQELQAIAPFNYKRERNKIYIAK